MIYLVAADRVVHELEQIEARIEPARPMAVSELMPQLQAEDARRHRLVGGRCRGGACPGFEIAGAERHRSGGRRPRGHRARAAAVQICAYQVATR